MASLRRESRGGGEYHSTQSGGGQKEEQRKNEKASMETATGKRTKIGVVSPDFRNERIGPFSGLLSVVLVALCRNAYWLHGMVVEYAFPRRTVGTSGKSYGKMGSMGCMTTRGIVSGVVFCTGVSYLGLR